MESAELVLLRLINVASFDHFLDERFGIELMGFQQIVQGIAVIPQLGVEQADEEMGVHLEVIGKVHGGKQVTTHHPALSTE